MANTYLKYLDSFQFFKSPDDFEKVHGSIFTSNLTDVTPSSSNVRSTVVSTKIINRQANFSRFSVAQKDVTVFLKEEESAIPDNIPENQHSRNSILNSKPVDSDALVMKVRPKRVNNTEQCPACEKLFTSSHNLKKHILIHTGNKSFECEQCKKKFRQKGNLKRHMLIHTGERPVKCEKFEKTFNKKSNMRTHMRTHIVDKPFNCEQCDKKFNRKSSLKNHMRTHRGNNMPFECKQ